MVKLGWRDYTDDWSNYPVLNESVLLNAGHPDAEEDVLISQPLTQLLKPHQDIVRKIDKQMNNHRADLDGLTTTLLDESLYTDASRKQEMTGLLRQQAEIKSALETLEWEWLEASEKLEQAAKNLASTS